MASETWRGGLPRPIRLGHGKASKQLIGDGLSSTSHWPFPRHPSSLGVSAILAGLKPSRGNTMIGVLAKALRPPRGDLRPQVDFTMLNSFHSLTTLSVDQHKFRYFRLGALKDAGLDPSRLPYSLKILLENLLR